MDKQALFTGYMLHKIAAAGEVMGAIKGVAGAGIDVADKAVRLTADTAAKAAPYLLAAPPILGLMAGYGVAQATSPTGEDITEAQKHLEQQALLQHLEDIERNRIAHKVLQKKILAKAKAKTKAGKGTQREVRL